MWSERITATRLVILKAVCETIATVFTQAAGIIQVGSHEQIAEIMQA